MKGCFWVLLFFITGVTKAQVLESFPQINAGGKINAMAFDSLNNIIYIVGDFVQVSLSSRKNLAAINKSTGAVIGSFNPISSMTGSIASLQVIGNRLYLGGDFTAINGNAAQRYLARVDLSVNGSVGTLNGAFNVGTDAAVTDLQHWGDTLFVLNNGMAVDDPLTGEVHPNIGCLSAASGIPLHFSPSLLSANSSMHWGSMTAVGLKAEQQRLFLYGKNLGGAYCDGIVAFQLPGGIVDPSFHPSFTFEQVIDVEFYNGKSYILNSKIWPTGFALMEFDSTNIMTPGAFLFSGGNAAPCDLIRYKNLLFVAGNFTQAQNQNSPNLCAIRLNDFGNNGWNPNPNTSFSSGKNLFVLQNKLYVTEYNLSTISGQNRNGVARYCLPPHDPQEIFISDASICPWQNGISAYVNSIPYASIYEWWTDMSGITISGNTQNILLSASSSISSGNLYITANACGLRSDTISIPLNAEIAPIALAGNDTLFNCIHPQTILFPQQTSSACTYQWDMEGNNSWESDSITAEVSANYILRVQDTLTLCFNYDTLFVFADTLHPIPLLPTGPHQLNCRDSHLVLFGNSTANTMLEWLDVFGNVYPDPAIINSPGQYYLKATDLNNGCSDSSFLFVYENILSPDIFISYPLNNSFVLDTINCLDTISHVEGASFSPNVIFSWEFSDTTVQIINSDAVDINQGGIWKLIGVDTVNFCQSEIQFFIYSDLLPPVYPSNLYVPSLNCSIDSIRLDTLISNPNWTVEWIVDSATIFNYPIYATDTGAYSVIITDINNQCKDTGLIIIHHNSDIIFSGVEFQINCKNTSIQIDPGPMGNHNYEFLWDSVWTTDSIYTVNLSSDTTFNVLVRSENCLDTFSTTIEVSSYYLDSVLTYDPCQSGNLSLELFSHGDSPPFSFQLNDIPWSEETTFHHLLPGFQWLTVQDSLNCLFHDSIAINFQTATTFPWFTFDSDLFLGDTAVLVNVSHPTPQHSYWELSGANTLHSFDQFECNIIITDSLQSSVTLFVLYPDCALSVERVLNIKSIPIGIDESGILMSDPYPNPTNGPLTLELNLFPYESFIIQWIRSDGSSKTIWSSTSDSSFLIPVLSFDFSNETPGTYLIRVITESRVEQKSIILLDH